MVGKNYIVINIDGLDVSGKETFVKNLKKMVNELLVTHHANDRELEIITHSFPTYESVVGAKIKAVLNTDINERNKAQLDMLFAYDRLDVCSKISKTSLSNKSKFHVIIFDRYYISNLIYGVVGNKDIMNAIKTMESNGKSKEEIIDFIFNNTNPGWQYNMEKSILLNPDVCCMFYRKDKVGEELHKKLLLEKPSKDKNETLEFQASLNDFIKTYIMGDTSRFFDKDTTIYDVNVGSTFSDIHLELSCLDHIRNAYHTFLVNKYW